MSDLRDIYQQVILDHNKKPRNFRAMTDANHDAEGFNPLCGDKLHLYLRTEGGVIVDVSFEGAGCAISTASASMMTESLRGKSLEEAEAIFDRFHQMLTGDSAEAAGAELGSDPVLGKLSVFAGVCEFPMRVKCATLAWHTLKAALEGDENVSTE